MAALVERVGEAVDIEPKPGRDVEPKPGRDGSDGRLGEGSLVAEQGVVHRPEPVLRSSGLGLRGETGVWMDLVEGEVGMAVLSRTRS